MARVLGREPGITVLGSAGTGREALRAVLDRRPDVVLLADRLKDVAGPALCRAILGHSPDTAIAVMSARPNREAVEAYLAAGAQGFIAGDARERDLATMIRTMGDGIAVFSPSVVSSLAPRVRSVDGRHGSSLDPREARVLSLVSYGLSNRQIAERLGVSESTVKAVLRGSMRKLGAARRSEAVATAIARGLIEMSGVASGAAKAGPGRPGAAPAGEGAGKLNVTVGVVDHREVIRQGLSAIVANIPGAEVVGCAGSGSAGVTMVIEHRPDVVLVDARVQDRGIVDLCRALAEERSRTRVLVFGVASWRDAWLPLMAGARACLIGEMTSGVLRRALDVIAGDERAPGDSIVDWASLQEPLVRTLPPIDLRVLELLSHGQTNNEIARQIGLSSHSAKRYVARVFERLGVHSRAEAVAAAIQAGLIRPRSEGSPSARRAVRTGSVNQMGIVGTKETSLPSSSSREAPVS